MSEAEIIEFLEWLKKRGLILAIYHSHSDRCPIKNGKRTGCGYFNGELQPTKTDALELAHSYIEEKARPE